MEDFNDFIQGFEVRTIFDGLMLQVRYVGDVQQGETFKREVTVTWRRTVLLNSHHFTYLSFTLLNTQRFN